MLRIHAHLQHMTITAKVLLAQGPKAWYCHPARTLYDKHVACCAARQEGIYTFLKLDKSTKPWTVDNL